VLAAILGGCGGARSATAGPDAATVAAARRAVVAPLLRDARILRALVGRPYALQRRALLAMAARLRVAARQAPNTDVPPFQYLGGEAEDLAVNARVPYALDSYLRAKAGRLVRFARYSLTPEHAQPLRQRWLADHSQLPTSAGTVAWLAQWEGTVNGCYVLIGSGYSTGEFDPATRGRGLLRTEPDCRRPRGPLVHRDGTYKFFRTPPREGAARIVADRQSYLLVRTRAGGCFTFTLASATLDRARRSRCAAA
jgi:hypothetical protein